MPPVPTAVVTTADGQRVEGRVTYLDDFTIALVMADGSLRSFRIERDQCYACDRVAKSEV